MFNACFLNNFLLWETVGSLSVMCRPTVDRQSTDRFFGELFFTITLSCSLWEISEISSLDTIFFSSNSSTRPKSWCFLNIPVLFWGVCSASAFFTSLSLGVSPKTRWLLRGAGSLSTSCCIALSGLGGSLLDRIDSIENKIELSTDNVKT